MLLIHLLLAVNSFITSAEFPEEPPPPDIECYPAENLVLKSMLIHGFYMDQMKSSSKKDFGKIKSSVALENTLDIAAISQEMLKNREEEVLQSFSEDPKCYAETLYRYAKFSDCPIPRKLEFFNRIIDLEDSDEFFFLRGKAAFELLRYSYRLDDIRVQELFDVLKSSLERYERREISVSELWIFMSDIRDELLGNSELENLIKEYFPQVLMKKIEDYAKKAETIDGYYGIRLYPRQSYSIVPQNVTDFWSEKGREPIMRRE